jgi:hypothetical protein
VKTRRHSTRKVGELNSRGFAKSARIISNRRGVTRKRWPRWHGRRKRLRRLLDKSIKS